MQADHYLGRLEQSVGDAAALTKVQDDAEADQALAPEDRSLILGRAGGYLADMGRAGDIPDDDGYDGDAGASS